jgi:hypothetical protein
MVLHEVKKAGGSQFEQIRMQVPPSKVLAGCATRQPKA